MQRSGSHIGPGKTESDDLSPVITGDVQLEAVTPPHRAFPVVGNALENLIGMASEVITDQNHLLSTKPMPEQRPKAWSFRKNISLKNTRLTSSTNLF